MKIKSPKTNRQTPQPVDSRFRYLEYKDRYQGLIRKRKRVGIHPNHARKNLTLQLDKVDPNRRCLAWPYCDVEIEDNNYNVACREHWYLLPKQTRNEVNAILRRYPEKSRVRKAFMKKIAERLQLAGKRGKVVRVHMNDYTVVEEKREEL